MEIILTIFTPTFNREETLIRLYKSLANQTLKNFEWLVIDDGSTDDTENLISNFIKENKIPIQYFKQENLGKQAAWNCAVKISDKKYFLGVDSDDVLYGNETIKDIFSKYIHRLDESKKLIALRGLAFSTAKNGYSAKKISSKDMVEESWLKEIKYNSVGDRSDIWLTSVLKSFLYPVGDNIKFIPELWLYASLSELEYNFIYINEPVIRIYDNHNNNRLSSASLQKNAKGQYIARRKLIRAVPFYMWFHNFPYLIRNLIRYSQFANYLKISFKLRLRDVGIIYTLFSYLFLPFNIGMK